MTARRATDRGSATAELAVALPGVVVILVSILLAGAVGVAQIACQDSARVMARAAALGGEIGQAPEGANATVTLDGDWIRVEVRREVGVFGVAVTVVGRATALLEPTARAP